MLIRKPVYVSVSRKKKKNSRKLQISVVILALVVVVVGHVHDRIYPPLGRFIVKGKTVLIDCYPTKNHLTRGNEYSAVLRSWQQWVLSTDTIGVSEDKKAVAYFIAADRYR